MTATLAVADTGIGPFRRYIGGAGEDDNDAPIVASDLLQFDTFMLMSTAGVMDVFVSLDGTNFTTAALSLADLGAVDLTPVLVTSAGRLYGFRGALAAIRVDQNGVTAVADACLTCSRSVR